MRLIRQYCLNGPATRLRIVSAGNQTFSHAHFKHANFEDQNYTVSLPIFTIHGNHDDLSGKAGLLFEVEFLFRVKPHSTCSTRPAW